MCLRVFWQIRWKLLEPAKLLVLQIAFMLSKVGNRDEEEEETYVETVRSVIRRKRSDGASDTNNITLWVRRWTLRQQITCFNSHLINIFHWEAAPDIDGGPQLLKSKINIEINGKNLVSVSDYYLISCYISWIRLHWIKGGLLAEVCALLPF